MGSPDSMGLTTPGASIRGSKKLLIKDQGPGSSTGLSTLMSSPTQDILNSQIIHDSTGLAISAVSQGKYSKATNWWEGKTGLIHLNAPCVQ